MLVINDGHDVGICLQEVIGSELDIQRSIFVGTKTKYVEVVSPTQIQLTEAFIYP